MKSAPERRVALLERILDYGETTIDNLAFQFDVGRRTIERDLQYLETTSVFGSLFRKIPGRGGGVKPNWEWREAFWTVTPEEEDAIREAIPYVSARNQIVLQNLLLKHGKSQIIENSSLP